MNNTVVSGPDGDFLCLIDYRVLIITIKNDKTESKIRGESFRIRCELRTTEVRNYKIF